MKATSSKLEVYVKIDQAESLSLRTNPLFGRLNFRDDLISLDRKIPITIKHVREQKELLEVEQAPKDVYFGRAEDIIFQINSDYYDELIKNKEFVYRFSVGGKLLIRIEDM